MDRERGLVAICVMLVILAAPAGYALAQSLTHSATAGTTYETNSGLEVTLGSDRDVAAVPFNGDETFADGGVELSADGEAEATINDATYAGETMSVGGIDAWDSNLTVDRSDLGAVTVGDGVDSVVVHETGLDDGETDLEIAGSQDMHVTFEATGIATGGVQLVDSDGDIVAGTTDQIDGTTLELPAGTHELRLQDGPSALKLFDESNPDQQITDSDVELAVRFFGTDSDAIEVRQAENGEIDMSGLPADEPLLVEARDDSGEFVERRTLIDSILEQQRVYLLPETADAVEVEFVLDDQTGDFDNSDSSIQISRPIERDGDIRFEALAGDEFGVGGFSTTLEQGERYQIRIQNDAGETRELGDFVAARDELRELQVGELEWEIGDSRGEEERLTIASDRFEDDGDEFVRFRINDSAGELRNAEVLIHQLGNDSNVLHQSSHSGERISVTEPLNAEQQNVTGWVVQYRADRQATGERIEGQEIIGGGGYSIPMPGGQDTTALFSGLLLAFVGGFFSARVADIGVIVVPSLALGLWAIGWLPLPLSWVLAGLTLGVASEFAARGGFSVR